MNARPTTTLLLQALLAAVPACGGVGGPASQPVAPPPPLTPPPIATVAAQPLATASPVSAVDVGPLRPLVHGFVPQPLLLTPSGIRVTWTDAELARWATKGSAKDLNVVSVHGTARDDVWVLTDEQILVHLDGDRVVEQFKKPCGWGVAGDEPYAKKYLRVLADERRVHVMGSWREPDWRVGGDLTASLDRKTRTWTCHAAGVQPILAESSGDRTWKLQNPAMGNTTCQLQPIGGACVPVPDWAPSYVEPTHDTTDYGVWSQALWMRGLDDGWIADTDERGRPWLFRFNGVAWSPVQQLPARCADLWADNEGRAWVLLAKKGAGSALTGEGPTLAALAVPASFSARYVRGASARDVWFVGEDPIAYHWDGAELRQGPTPFRVTDMWVSPDGELWIVGEGRLAHTSKLARATR